MAGIPIPSSKLVDPRTGLVSQDWFLFLSGETKSWTPTDVSGASLVFAVTSAAWTQIGRLVFAYAQVTYPVTANAAAAVIGNLPVVVPGLGYANQGFLSYTNSAVANKITAVSGSNTAAFFSAAGVAATNANMSGTRNHFMLIYPVQ